MKIRYIKNACEIIKTVFEDNRILKCPNHKVQKLLDDELFEDGDIFQTADGEYIYFNIQLKDFDEEELVKKVEIGEKLYELVEKPVSVYILCQKNVNVRVKECEIKSDAVFKIKLAKSCIDPAESTLNFIKEKIAHNQPLSEEDLEALGNLPMICDKEKRNYYRLEYFKIINRYTH